MLHRLLFGSTMIGSRTARHARKHSYRRAKAGAAISTLILAGVMSGTIMLPIPQARAVHGNPSGGSGHFTSDIDWIDWTEMTGTRFENQTQILPDGATGVSWSTPVQISDNIWRTSRCTISNVITTNIGKNNSNLTIHKGIEVGYNTGNWQGDGLARLYNDGSNYNNGTAIKNIFRSNLLIGIENLQDSSTQQFQATCKTYLVNSDIKPTKNQLENFPNKIELPMEGMVFADAEASNWTGPASRREYITVSPTSFVTNRDISYHLLETAQPAAGCKTNSWGGLITVSTPIGYRNGIKLRTDGSECSSQVHGGYGPSSVMLISNSNGGFIEIHGGGKSAVALGVVSYMDFGDAPDSYGIAGSIFQPTWIGGNLSGLEKQDIHFQNGPVDSESGSWFNLSQASTQHQVATAKSAVVRLGNLTDNDESIVHSIDGTLDDTIGIDDEDALPDNWDRVIWTDIGKQWSQQIICSGQDTKIAGWIDWNHDGTFTSTERSELTTCSNQGTATLTWTVPQDAKRTTISGNGAATFMRLRITGSLPNGQAAEDPKPIGIALNGEVEDYTVQVQLPNLTMTKIVDNTAAGTLGLATNDWTLTATPTTGMPATGLGGFTSSYLPQGDAVLSESSISPKAAGYKPAITCIPHPNSDLSNPVSTFESTTNTLHLATGEWIHCTITNTAQPGQIIWTKSDQDGVPLAGATFTLTSPILTDGQVNVPDCTTNNIPCPITSIDQDPQPGHFKIINLTWAEYTLTETQAPQGYQLSSTSITKTLDGSAPPASANDTTPTLNLGSITNAPIHGTATWTKTDENHHPIQDSQWSLTPLDTNGHPVPDKTLTITDCVTTCPEDSLDTDNRPGAFKLEQLDYGTYQLVESKAPTGYILDATPHTITITNPDQNIDLGELINRKTAVPIIPLTGGTSTQTYLIAGTILLALTSLAILIQTRRHRRVNKD